MMHRLIMAIGVVVAAWLAVGCGGSKDDATSAPLTRAQYTNQANAICKKFTKQRKAAAAAWTEKLPGGAGAVDAHVDEGFEEVIAPSIREEAEQLANLAPPEQDAVKIARMVRNLSEGSRVFARVGAEGVSRPPIHAFQNAAKAYGLEACFELY